MLAACGGITEPSDPCVKVSENVSTPNSGVEYRVCSRQSVVGIRDSLPKPTTGSLTIIFCFRAPGKNYAVCPDGSVIRDPPRRIDVPSKT